MMIRTAGGPGLVSPIDFHERKSPRLSRSAWTAIALAAAAHVGVGVALYYQRFEMPQPLATPTDDPFDITLERLPEPPPVQAKREPVAPNMPTHETPAPTTDTEVLETPINRDATPTTSTTITLGHVVPESVDDAKPAAEPITEPPAPRIINNPSWIRQPTADQMMRAYPDRAIERGVAGSVSLNCLVEANGTVSGCAVTGETPANYGFGRSAQQLSRYFRVSPRTVNGAPEGSRVAINLRFVPPAD